MNSPFPWLGRSGELTVFGLSLAITLLVGWWLKRHGQDLTTKRAPHAVVSLQLAWSASRAEAILKSWDEKKLRPTAVAQIAWDYLFLIAYSVFLSLSCILISRHVRPPLSDLGVVLAWAAVGAGVFDALENSFHLLLLTRGVKAGLSMSATICAGLKFTGIFAVCGYWAAAALQRFVDLVKLGLGNNAV